MPIFKSHQPDFELPTDFAIWEWLFRPDVSKWSPLNRPISEQSGFTDAITKERVNWTEVAQLSTYISTALVKKYGYKQGQTLALFSRNTIWYPVMLFAALRVGGVVSGASPAYNVEEMTYALKTADAKFFATSPTSMAVAVEAAKAAGIPKSNIFLLEGEMEGFTTIQDLIEMGKKYGKEQVPDFKIPKGKKNKDVCAFLSFSSGTTGLPKAVMISHQNMRKLLLTAYSIAQTMGADSMKPPHYKNVIAVLPMFHITGLAWIVHIPIICNAETYFLPSFDMRTMCQAVVDYQINELLLVPPILIRLVRDPVVKEYDLSHVKAFSSGAAPVSAEILQALSKQFPNAGFKQGYGMTESCSCITAHPPEFYDFKYGTAVGKVWPRTEIKLVKDDGIECGVGEEGELLARGPQITMGYLNNEKATKETYDADGFLHTGDIAVVDKQGLVTIVDRKKELIKVNGIGVAPAELEDLLLGHPMVEDSAVISIKNDYTGEVPKAYIRLKPGQKPSKETGLDIIKYVKERKVRHKWLSGVEFIEEIPKSASGKILRKDLRNMKPGQSGMEVKEERAKL